MSAMGMQVIKRDGSTVSFDRHKIVVAIQKANKAVEEGERLPESDIDTIASFVEGKKRKRFLVEDIQDMVEKQIMNRGRYELAKAYIIYRYNRALVRKANTTDESILSLISNKNKDVMEENSNKNAVMVSTQRDLIAGEVSRDLTRCRKRFPVLMMKVSFTFMIRTILSSPCSIAALSILGICWIMERSCMANSLKAQRASKLPARS